MSEAMKGNVMEELEKKGIDISATLDNIIKQFPNLIVFGKADTHVNDGCEKTADSNTAADDCGNKEQEYHKPGNNCKENADPNKCNCDCSKCENEGDTEGEQEQPCRLDSCMIMGSLDPQTALLLNILEGLSAINDNICDIGRVIKENSPKEIKEAAELKTCKMHKGVSKKQMVKLLDEQKSDIYEEISGLIELRFADLKEMIMNHDAFQKKENGKRNK